VLKRVYIKELLSFDEVELDLSNGLIVFSGSSGAGKTLLFQAILANFGSGNPEARVCEIEMKKPSTLEVKEFELDEMVIIKSIKRERVRLYLNSQNISKKRLGRLFAPYIHHLSVRKDSDFNSQRLLSIIDLSISSKNTLFKEIYTEYRDRFEVYRKKVIELEKIEREQQRVVELIEFTKFEIDRVTSIEPKEGEYEELLAIKNRLSKIDKIQEAMERAERVFELERDVDKVFNLLNRDGSYFSETMNQLRVDFEEIESLALELESANIENVLDRLEKLSSLIIRYGSIKNALEYRDRKVIELQKYESIKYSKRELEEFIRFERGELLLLAKKLSTMRKEGVESVKSGLNGYLRNLKLREVNFIFRERDIFNIGIDEVDLELEGSTISTLSAGEFNRLKLALLTVEAKMLSTGEGVIFLDEMDANVSGDESIAISNMVEELSRKFQVFAISHQPHLSAKADQHILISKSGGVSRTEVLNREGRLKEMVRMISGESANREATAFAEKLFKQRRRQSDYRYTLPS
jgi:DNA repair protein RecN (Recombination protein N)